MQKQVVLCSFTEYERGWGCRPDGYSVHIDEKSFNDYIKLLDSNKSTSVPDEYSSPDTPCLASIDEDGYEYLVAKGGTVRFFNHSDVFKVTRNENSKLIPYTVTYSPSKILCFTNTDKTKLYSVDNIQIETSDYILVLLKNEKTQKVKDVPVLFTKSKSKDGTVVLSCQNKDMDFIPVTSIKEINKLRMA